MNRDTYRSKNKDGFGNRYSSRAMRRLAQLLLMGILITSSLYGCSLSDTMKQTDEVNAGTNTNNEEADNVGIETVSNTEMLSITPIIVDTALLSQELKEDYDDLSVSGIDEVKGNLHLPITGANGSVITWVSSAPSIISDTEIINDKYDSTPAGVVIRQAADIEVVLTATISLLEETVQKQFIAKVKAKYVMPELTDYVFAYFTGNGVGQEAIFLSTSQDGFNWTELNHRKSILQSELGTKGLRDPFIIRSPEGDKFYLIATDLCIAADGDWWKAQTHGSTSIMIWESEDLVNWSEQRMVQVSRDSAGCTWAPECYYDAITGEYLVFWASRVLSDNYGKQRIFYVKTRDFVTFTAPKVWIDYDFSTIDTTVVKEGDSYYRFTKYEDTSTILMETAKSLLGTWTKVSSAMLDAQSGVEGPCSFSFNEEDIVDGKRWGLLLDKFGGNGYYLLVSNTLSDAVFEKKMGYQLPDVKPRHGTVMQITAAEYQKLMQ